MAYRTIPSPDGWFKADSITGHTVGDVITSWADSSGNGNDASVLSASGNTIAGPTYQTDSTNGWAYLDFVTDTSVKALTSPLNALSSNVTIIAVAISHDVSTYHGLLDADGVGGIGLRTYTSGGLQFITNSTGSATQSDGRPNYKVETPTILTAGWDGATVDYYVNGMAFGSKAFAPSQGSTSSNTVIGASYVAGPTVASMDGGIAELIIYERQLTDAERATVHSYLHDKYRVFAADYVPVGTAPDFPISGLVARYEANLDTSQTNGTSLSTISDFSGNGYNLTLVNTAGTYATNVVNGQPAYTIPSNGYYVATKVTYPAMAPSYSSVTITAVVSANPTHTTRSWPFGLPYNGSASLFAFTDGATSGQYGAFLRGTNSTAQVTFSDLVFDTPWTILTMVYDGSTTTIYANGKVVFSGASSGNQSTDEIAMGSIVSQNWAGYIAMAAVWGRALNSTEIQTLHTYAQETYGVATADYIAPTEAAGGNIKVWDGSAFSAKPIKVWDGTTWNVKPLKVWDGSAWQETNY